MNANKVIYYITSLMLSVIILMISGEEICKCNCDKVQKFALRSYIFGDEFLIQKKQADNTVIPVIATSAYDRKACESKRYYRFPIEILAALLFFVLMTAFIVF